jgi:hypothetical protein
MATVPPVRLTLITRQDCHLCEEMAAVIEEVTASIPAQLEQLDVDAEANLLALYSDEVPVLLINGRKAFKYRVTATELSRRLRAVSERQG